MLRRRYDLWVVVRQEYQGAQALTSTVAFFRSKNVVLTNIRMDNQTSPELRLTARNQQLTLGLVNANQKEPNRSERAIQTAKHHIIATRAGFHQDCPHIYLDKCLGQMLTLNLIHPYEYDPTISAYHGLFGSTLISCPTRLHQQGLKS